MIFARFKAKPKKEKPNATVSNALASLFGFKAVEAPSSGRTSPVVTEVPLDESPEIPSMGGLCTRFKTLFAKEMQTITI